MAELTRVTELVIDRSKWARGDAEICAARGIGDTHERGLLDYTGGMCCLGFLAEACGETQMNMSGEPLPSEEIAELFGLYHENACDEDDVYDGDFVWRDFINTNDSSDPVTSPIRESKLKKLFKEKLGVKVTFKGRTPPEVK